MLASAVLGAAAATLATAASGGQLGTIAASATAALAATDAGEPGMSEARGGLNPLPAAGEPLAGRTSLSAAEASGRTALQRVAREARRRKVLLAEARRPKWVLPIRSYRTTTCFCTRWGAMHTGLDLAAPLGTPIYAAGDGVVVEAGPASGFGNLIMIQHANGDVTVYGHEEKVLVVAGERVRAGQLIALNGSRGNSTGPHLHFEVRTGDEYGPPVDPIDYLAVRGVTI